MTCSNCGDEINPGKSFCGGCGTTITAPESGRADQENCPRCGSETSASKRFCGVCGHGVHAENEPIPQTAAAVLASGINQPGAATMGMAAHPAMYSDSQAAGVGAPNFTPTGGSVLSRKKRSITWLTITASVVVLASAAYMLLPRTVKTAGTAASIGGPSRTQPTAGVTGHGVSPNTDFDRFYSQFRRAVRLRDQAALRNLMAPQFQYALDGYTTRDQALNNLAQMGWPAFWESAAGAVARSARPCKPGACNNRSGYETFAMKPIPFGMLFEKGADNRWYWSALLGD
jgi:hypothetical protein